jgi:putative colanic acid biosynthesis UDP-glucose lipid carrier transferase
MNITQRLLDIIVLVAVTWSVSGGLIPGALAKVLVVYCALLLLAVFSLFHVYQRWQKAGRMRQVRKLAAAWITVLVAFNLIILLLSTEDQLAVLTPYGLFASAGFNAWALLVFGGLAFTRSILHAGIGILRHHGYYRQRAIIVGAGDTGRKLAHYLVENRWIGIELAGFFDDKMTAGALIESGTGALGEVIGAIDDCYQYCAKEKIALVYLALPLRAEKKISRIVSRLGTSGHEVLLVQDLFSFGIQKARTRHLGELQVLNFNLFPFWKRVFDIVFSSVVVVITLPFWLLIMLAIKAEDGGPVFFRHPRVMEGGKRFDCLKFRSMHLDAEQRLRHILDRDDALRQQWRERYKLDDDPRVTKVGKFLRRFNIDELPQFLNVLSGEMSVVGARPVVPEELILYYRDATLTYCAMKPGITGPWQVSKQIQQLDYTGRVELDRRYILNCSFWTDLFIIMKTVWLTIVAKGS